MEIEIDGKVVIPAHLTIAEEVFSHYTIIAHTREHISGEQATISLYPEGESDEPIQIAGYVVSTGISEEMDATSLTIEPSPPGMVVKGGVFGSPREAVQHIARQLGLKTDIAGYLKPGTIYLPTFIFAELDDIMTAFRSSKPLLWAITSSQKLKVRPFEPSDAKTMAPYLYVFSLTKKVLPPAVIESYQTQSLQSPSSTGQIHTLFTNPESSDDYYSSKTVENIVEIQAVTEIGVHSFYEVLDWVTLPSSTGEYELTGVITALVITYDSQTPNIRGVYRIWSST